MSGPACSASCRNISRRSAGVRCSVGPGEHRPHARLSPRRRRARPALPSSAQFGAAVPAASAEARPRGRRPSARARGRPPHERRSARRRPGRLGGCSAAQPAAPAARGPHPASSSVQVQAGGHLRSPPGRSSRRGRSPAPAQPGVPGSSGRTWSGPGRCRAPAAPACRPARCGIAPPALRVPAASPGRASAAQRGIRDTVAGVGRAARRLEAAQVRVELAVRVPVGGPVRPAQRQRGLADTRHAADRRDQHRTAPVCLVEQASEGFQLLGPAGKVPGRRR